MPKKSKDDMEDGEFMEGDEYYYDEEEIFEGEESEVSAAKRRRIRRKKLDRKFKIMKTGKFHLIQDVLREE